jgi:hypothetical protein
MGLVTVDTVLPVTGLSMHRVTQFPMVTDPLPLRVSVPTEPLAT